MTKSKTETISTIKDMQANISEDPPVKNWISTGCTILDLAVSNRIPGGLPGARIVQIFGPESSCKTVLGMTVLGANIRDGGLSFFGDSEGTFDFRWAKLYGLDSANDNFFYTGGTDFPDTIEGFWEDWMKVIIGFETDKPKVVVVDSLSSISDSMEMGDDLGKGSYNMKKAKVLSAAFRKYNKQMMRSGVTLILLDQIRDKVGSPYAGAVTVGGGKAVPFYASTRIQLKQPKKVKNSKDVVEGIDITFDIIKNKAGYPHRPGTFRVLFDYGLDDIWSNVNFLKEQQDGKRGTKVKLGDVEKAPSFMVKYVEKENLEEALIAEVVKTWGQMYKPGDRKERKWD